MGRRVLFSLMVCCLIVLSVVAQDNTWNLTLYQNYKPAVVNMLDGTVVKTSLANVFLKNASLLFKRGEATLEANMATIQSVTIGEHRIVNIKNMLAREVGSSGGNRLYCVTLIDLDSYKAMLRNDVNITNLTIGDQLSYTTIDLNPTEGLTLPLIRQFYFQYNGEVFHVHEREVTRRLPKEKKRLYKTIIGMDDFSWVDGASLMKLLDMMTREVKD